MLPFKMVILVLIGSEQELQTQLLKQRLNE